MSTNYATSFSGDGYFVPQVIDPDDVPRRVWYCDDYEMEFATPDDAARWFCDYCHYEQDRDIETSIQDVLMTNNRGIIAEYGRPVLMLFRQCLPSDQEVF